MAETEPLFSVQYIAQTHLPQIVPALFVVPALRQRVPTVRAGHPGVEIRRVIGQQTVADHLLFSPDRQQPRLRPLEFIFFSASPVWMRSKQSQNSCEVNRSAGKPHSEERIVCRYHFSTSVLGPG